MKCLSKDRNNKGCRNRCIGETRFCKLHQYMNEYTDVMLEQLQLCSGCRKMYYMGNSGYVNCEGCRGREKNKKDIVFCKSDNCKFKKSEENDYCGKHQICIFVDETNTIGKKVCVNYIRGCRTQLDLSYTYTKCGGCLKKDREKDRKRRGDAQEKNKQIETTETILTYKYCATCCKEYSIDEFVGEIENIIMKTCKCCRTQNNIQNVKRNKEHRYTMSKQNLFANYNAYIKDTCSRNIPFDLTYDQYIKIVHDPCYYCNITDSSKGFNGIDRKNSDIGYIIDNCVSCCKMCNKLKGTLDDLCFIRRIGHILSYNKRVDEKITFTELFGNHIASNYNIFNKIAVERQLQFELSLEHFQLITSENCYICGKQNTEMHKNGIDRFNNEIGYVIENCKSCCTECNFMKGIYNYDLFMEKIQLIYNKNKALICRNVITNSNISYIPEIFIQKRQKRVIKEKPSEVKTAEQIKEEARLRKKKQRDELKEKVGHAKYKEMRSEEMKTYRQNKYDELL